MSEQPERTRRYDSGRLGAYGEDRAQRWYLERGYDLLDRNWRHPDGELDLVLAIDEPGGRAVVFCEVKTRSTGRFGAPYEAVGRDKQRRLRRLALQWLAAHDLRAARLRFDVASVTSGRIEVLLDAF